jgi:hypothetical protein
MVPAAEIGGGGQDLERIQGRGPVMNLKMKVGA